MFTAFLKTEEELSLTESMFCYAVHLLFFFITQCSLQNKVVYDSADKVRLLLNFLCLK